MTVEALLKHEDITVVVGESMLGERIDLSMNRVVLLRDYPNSMYFRAFDATVQAGGYNSFHETRRFGLPALFYPNMNTGMDDQLARCKVAEDEGWGIVVVNRNTSSISEGIAHLLSTAGTLDGNLGRNGAEEVYTMLTGQAKHLPTTRVGSCQMTHFDGLRKTSKRTPPSWNLVVEMEVNDYPSDTICGGCQSTTESGLEKPNQTMFMLRLYRTHGRKNWVKPGGTILENSSMPSLRQSNSSSSMGRWAPSGEVVFCMSSNASQNSSIY